MKRILCFTLAVMMVMSVCSFSASAEENADLSQKFYDYCVEVLPEEMQPTEEDRVYIFDSVEISGITFFSANSWIEVSDTEVICRFGDINVFTGSTYYPYELGIYAVSGDKVYTLEEVYNMGEIDDVSVLANSFPVQYIFYKDYVPNPENKYESDVIQKVFSPGAWSSPYSGIFYDEMYEYYSDVNTSDDEATPDYVLVYVYGRWVTDALECNIYGDYVLQSYYGYTPFTYGYGIYIPETEEVYSLTKAYEMGIEGIEKVFTEAKVGRLMGDMDNDRKLTIKDATYIQKIVAGLVGYSDTDIYAADFDVSLPCSIGDFNRDRTMNVKDATAIQKNIAGIEA